MISYVMDPEEIATIPSFRTLPVTLTNGLDKFRTEGLQRLYDWTSIVKLTYGRPQAVIPKDFWDRSEDRSIYDFNREKQDPARSDVTLLSTCSPPTPCGHSVCTLGRP
jgi:hypothetical protein